MQHTIVKYLRERNPAWWKAGEPISIQVINTGSLHQCCRIGSTDFNVFCKVQSASKFPQLLFSEAEGLKALHAYAVFRLPAILDLFTIGDQQCLVLEFVEEAQPTAAFWQLFGSTLAALHARKADAFGGPSHNYMGTVLQSNQPSTSWTEFFYTHRLNPLLRICFNQSLLPPSMLSQLEIVAQCLHRYFPADLTPCPVHGDLWSGNFLCDKTQQPVLIDPAFYFGIPAVDIGMSRLFGGFDPVFYQAYKEASSDGLPTDEQWMVCNLYPLLIHLHLFGQAYLSRIRDLVDRLS